MFRRGGSAPKPLCLALKSMTMQLLKHGLIITQKADVQIFPLCLYCFWVFISKQNTYL